MKQETKLTPAELWVAQRLAEAWGRANKSRPNFKRSNGSDFELHKQGICAEIAFAKISNVYFAPTVSEGKLPEHDLKYRGATVDVKGTHYENGCLLAHPAKRDRAANIYALMIGSNLEWRFAGWASSGELFNEKNLTNLGHGNTYAMKQEALRPPLELAGIV